MFIGIDFSINSTAVTIKSNNEITIFSFVPNYRANIAAFEYHSLLSEFIHVYSYTKNDMTKNSIEDQSIKLKNADDLSNLIIKEIEPYIIGIPNVRIEGFSFGSKGNSFIDLITYNTFLKVKLIQKYGHCISVIAPKSLKKLYTGNGNATKCDMLRSYLNKSDSDLRNKLIDLGLNQEGEFKIGKPIDDIIDSIALCELV